MSLHEQIKIHRTRCGLSQEQLAERMNVSRQAVTKWETGRSAPSTENLLRLAEIFGVGVNELTATAPPPATDAAEALILAIRAEEARRLGERQARWRRNLLTAGGVTAGYLAWYLLCRMLYVPWENYSVLGWLFEADPQRLPYLYGWLTHSFRFWPMMLLSILLAIGGRRRGALVSLGGFLLGYILGECFGDLWADMYHYGWLLWGVTCLLALLGGWIWEKIRKNR